MKERPILFSAPMVQAILAGNKTQTRRIVKGCIPIGSENSPILFERCPYGQVGDQLWVKETWRTYESLDAVKPKNLEDGCIIDFAAGGNNLCNSTGVYGLSKKWRSPLFMQKRFSRIQLEITSVRVERLNVISEKDAVAEGCKSDAVLNAEKNDYTGLYAVDRYIDLWESINGAGSWIANPWVWVVEFGVIKP